MREEIATLADSRSKHRIRYSTVHSEWLEKVRGALNGLRALDLDC